MINIVKSLVYRPKRICRVPIAIASIIIAIGLASIIITIASITVYHS